MPTLFVYYKVALAEHAPCSALVTRLQATLQAQWPALKIEILQRPESSPEGLETWMEVYHHPGGVSPEIIAAIAQQAAAIGMPAKRATEIFVPLSQLVDQGASPKKI